MDHDDPIPNDPVGARVLEELRTRSIGVELNVAGITTVSIDNEGRMVEHRPDGTSYVLRHDQVGGVELEPGRGEPSQG